MICFLYLLTQVELGFNYRLRQTRCKPAVAGQAGKLGLAMACYDNDPIKVLRCPCFVEQGDINEQPLAPSEGGFGEDGPVVADDGMEDVFKDLAAVPIVKDERAKLAPVGPAGRIAGFMAECRDDRIANSVVRREQVMHAPVGIEMLHWQLLAQEPGEGAFSRGDAAGETEDRQGRKRRLAFEAPGSRIQCTPPLEAGAEVWIAR